MTHGDTHKGRASGPNIFSGGARSIEYEPPAWVVNGTCAASGAMHLVALHERDVRADLAQSLVRTEQRREIDVQNGQIGAGAWPKMALVIGAHGPGGADGVRRQGLVD